MGGCTVLFERKAWLLSLLSHDWWLFSACEVVLLSPICYDPSHTSAVSSIRTEWRCSTYTVDKMVEYWRIIFHVAHWQMIGAIIVFSIPICVSCAINFPFLKPADVSTGEVPFVRGVYRSVKTRWLCTSQELWHMQSRLYLLAVYFECFLVVWGDCFQATSVSSSFQWWHVCLNRSAARSLASLIKTRKVWGKATRTWYKRPAKSITFSNQSIESKSWYRIESKSWLLMCCLHAGE